MVAINTCRIGVSISVLAMVLLNHTYGSHDFMLVTPLCPWVVERSSITQHIRYAEIFRDLTMRVRSEVGCLHKVIHVLIV